MLRPLIPSPIRSFLSAQCIRQSLVMQCMRTAAIQTAFLHLDRSLLRKRTIPPPSSEIPNVKTFLERIGRDAAKECEDKIKTWRALFKADGKSLKENDIPVRLRRYILLQTEKYRNGEKIKSIRRGNKVNGGERRRNKGPTKTKIGR